MNTCLLIITLSLLIKANFLLKFDGIHGKCTEASDIRKIFFREKKECICKDWHKGVEQIHEGWSKVFKKYHGLTYTMGDTVMKSFRIYTDKLTSWTTCNSTILSSRSISILQAMTLLSASGKSASYLVKENEEAMDSLVEAYTKIVSELSDYVGALTTPINNAITEMANLMVTITKQFRNRFVKRKGSVDAPINFEAMIQSTQVLANTIGLMTETILDDCGCLTIPNETYDAVAILIFILNDCCIYVQSLFVSMTDVLYPDSSAISESLHKFLLSLDAFIQGVADVIDSMTNDLNKSVRILMVRVVDLLLPLNEANDNLMGPLAGAKITVGQIRRNLFPRQHWTENV
ncbi:hypothetical protein Bhyg_04356 [Pseudolycoriella hygida]|uniref:Uncharacterized protein n=1 Tax=Pseudolycoriella hygida TaxID=35572 RepID=A0A9Q0NF91_9DIPT|nr:hypothetical protein Bhyg_04356 [Pseudolycoriella hygida]